MNQINTTQKEFKRSIMKRIYISYCIFLLTHPVTVHSFLLAITMLFMTKYVSFAQVFHNILQIKVGELDSYVLGTLKTTEIWTLLLLGTIIFLLLSFRINVRNIKMQPMRVA